MPREGLRDKRGYTQNHRAVPNEHQMTLIRNGLIGAQGGTSASSSSSQLSLSDGLACFTASFSGITTTSFTHGLGTTDIVVEFKDSAGNLLIPDNWQAINNNTVSVEFPGSTAGDVTIIGCIASGLSAITGGVTLLEGLSGIIDLDSPNSSINISTSGQVINLNAIFTPASGVLLQQKNTQGVSLDFTPTSGTEFVMYHGLGTEKFLWDMWSTEVTPNRIVYPYNVVASGTNHVIISFDIPMSGFINLVGILI